MHRSPLLVFAVCLLLAIGRAQATQAEAPITLVEVDGFPVTNLHLALFATQTGRSPQDAEGQIALLNELVNNFMIASSVPGRALADRQEVVAALEVARARLIAQTFVRARLEEVEVDDARVQALYDARYGGDGRREYKARHILLETETEARDAIRELQGGADFATLARERSKGPSATVGGDLGWFEADQMVTEFATATAALADGAFTREPVKTEFGWHVILREDSRAAPPPALDSVRAELEQQLRQEAVARSITRIREAASIEVKDLEEK